MSGRRIYADLCKSIDLGYEMHIPLTTRGTWMDLEKHGIEFQDGLSVGLWMDDADDKGQDDPLHFEGVVHFHEERQYWYAVVDPKTIRNRSQKQ